MNVGSICSRHPVIVSKGATLAEVARLMRDEGVGAVIVTTAAQPAHVAGIITDRDIVRAQLERTADLSRLSAGDTMTVNPLVVTADEPLDGAIAHLRARGVRRAPVVAADGSLQGMVSADDLLAELAVELIGVAGVLAQQSRRDQPSKPPLRAE